MTGEIQEMVLAQAEQDVREFFSRLVDRFGIIPFDHQIADETLFAFRIDERVRRDESPFSVLTSDGLRQSFGYFTFEGNLAIMSGNNPFQFIFMCSYRI